MDFTLDPDHKALVSLAAEIFEDLATPQRVAALEVSERGIDDTLWRTLAEAGLLGLAVPEEWGGTGGGLLEVALVLEQQGRRVAPVPVWESLVLGAGPLAEFGTADQQARWLPGVVAGEVVLTAALNGVDVDAATCPVLGRPTADGLRLDGRLTSVPAAHLAARILVPVCVGQDDWRLVLLDPSDQGVARRSALTTNRQVHQHLTLESVVAPASELIEVTADQMRRLVDQAVCGLCALQVGVMQEALSLTSAHLNARTQFGRALGSFQAVAMRAADAYIDLEITRLAMLRAAWLLGGRWPAQAETRLAKWWAAEAGHRCLHAALHLHGGLGNDVEYPLHRYFLWQRQLGLTLGGAEGQLAGLGALVRTLR